MQKGICFSILPHSQVLTAHSTHIHFVSSDLVIYGLWVLVVMVGGSLVKKTSLSSVYI